MNNIEITNKDLAITCLITEIVCFFISFFTINIKEIYLVCAIGVFVFFILSMIFFWRLKDE